MFGHIIRNSMLNGEVIRLDGAKRRDEWRQKRTSRSLCLRDGFEAAVRGMFLAEACHVGLITTVEG
jgi:hypothetical protein